MTTDVKDFNVSDNNNGVKALLISPLFRSIGHSTVFTQELSSSILYIAAAVKAAGHSPVVRFADDSNIIQLVEEINPRIVGITCLTAAFPVVKRIVEQIKSCNPEILVIVGGHHPTFLTKEVFEETKVDYIARGEGEESFPKLLDEIARGNLYPIIPGIAYRKDGKLFQLDTYALVEDIDSLPRITKELFPSDAGFSLKIAASRGCPFTCKFCSITAFYRNRWRMRKIENIVADIDTYVSYGKERFGFFDDNFAVDARRVTELCQMIIARGLHRKIKWTALARVDTISRNPELIPLMQKAGCVELSFGVESGVQEVLDRFKKRTTLDQINKVIKLMSLSKINHIWYFILGTGDEFDTPEIVQRNIQFMKKIKFDLLQVSILTPFPGTELYEELSLQGRLKHKDWGKYDTSHCVYEPLGMSSTEMEKYFSRAYYSAYLSRGFGLFRMVYRGLRSGGIKPKVVIDVIKYVLKIIFGKKRIHDVAR